MSLKVAIVGTCPSSRMLAPYDDESWEIWTCSPDNAGKLPRVNRWFEIHGDLGWENRQEWEIKFIDWLNNQDFKLYVQLTHLFREDAIQFPYEELVNEFGTYWFTSTFAWMMALAIKEGAAEIGIFGADMAANTEYGFQRPGMRRFIEFAEDRKIKVIAPMESDILQPPPLYGYSVSTPMGKKLAIREREILKRVTDLRSRRERAIREFDHEIDHLVGALDQLDYDIKTWTGEPTVINQPTKLKIAFSKN